MFIHRAAVVRRAITDSAALDDKGRVVEIHRAAVAVHRGILQCRVSAQGHRNTWIIGAIGINNPRIAVCRHAAFAAAIQNNVGQRQIYIGGDEVVVAHRRSTGHGTTCPAAAAVGILAVRASGGRQDNGSSFKGAGGNVFRRRIVFHQHLHLVSAAGIESPVRIIQMRILVSQDAECADRALVIGIADIQLIKHSGILVYRIHIEEPAVGVSDLADRIARPDDLPQRGVGAVNDAVQALKDGYSDYAVIPQENTIGGPVTDYVDLIISETDVFVCGEVELPITQNLLTLPGTELSQITTVYSHKQGIAQGKEWLETNLPDAEVIEVSSTAEGARMVAEALDPAQAAIASASSAEVYGLEIAAAGIQNSDANKTRFYVLTLTEPQQKTGDRLAFTASGKAEDLPALMSAMEKQNVSLVTIHARPLKTELGQYAYLIECSGCGREQYKKLQESSPFAFRYLGCFDLH